MDVVVDADVLSSFLKIGRLSLLERLFPKSRFLISPSVNRELLEGEKLGYYSYKVSPRFLRARLSGAEGRLADKIRQMKRSLSLADAESIALAKMQECILLTNDRAVAAEADSLSIEHLSLPLLLRHMWKEGISSREEVEAVITELEAKDRIRIANKKIIFE